MARSKERGVFIDTIQAWFRERSRFWALVSISSLALLITLKVFIIVLMETRYSVTQGMDAIVIPLLAAFVVSVFWRSPIASFLSLAGAGSLYNGMAYIYSKTSGFEMHKPPFTSLLSGDTLHITYVANFYFIVGIFTLLLCLAIEFKPSFFRAKGSPRAPSYPVWSEASEAEVRGRRNLARLVPVLGLLRIEERYLASNYKYLQIMMGGTTYLVSPEDWVPENSIILRDEETGSLLGVPRVPDGFGIW